MPLEIMETVDLLWGLIANKPGVPYFNPYNFRDRLEAVVKTYPFLANHLYFQTDAGSFYKKDIPGRFEMHCRLGSFSRKEKPWSLVMTDKTRESMLRSLEKYDRETINSLDNLAREVWGNEHKQTGEDPPIKFY